jgi:broad specificity phosphatase PhoE
VIDQLILVRHGETVHNVAGIAQGWNDSALSEMGLAQVRLLAARLRHVGASALYSSPLGRALSTARIIAEETGLEIVALDDLREMNYGGWEGRSFLEVRRDDHAIYERWIVNGDTPCPGGESHNDVLRRMQSAFRAIEQQANGAAVRAIVVTHGTAIRVGATALLAAPVMTSRHLAQDNASVNIFMRRGDRLVLKTWNDTTHCADVGPNQKAETRNQKPETRT